VARSEKPLGKVALVGAGPGDPGLITVKGMKCLQEADVVVYDSLVNPAILCYVHPQAEHTFVGKRASCHTMAQELINKLLIEEARQGKKVVRLKGGDPFLFGRGGEEAEALADAGIPFEVVPGVCSPVAVPAYAGIPVTHRNYTSTFAVATGQTCKDDSLFPMDWEKLANSAGTLVFLMCIKNLREIAGKLVQHGRRPETPAAVIQWGTRPEQRTATGTLGQIADRACEAGLGPPGLLIVGDVVGLREKLNWYEGKPLFGERILVTQPLGEAGELMDALESHGAEVLPFESAQSGLADVAVTMVTFTDAAAVERFARSLGKAALGGLSPAVRYASMEPNTSRAVRDLGLTVHIEARQPTPVSLVEAILDACKKDGA
jgi:uroporphyrinogen III methyltransferase/synthase